jgi:hypothetical protein
MGISTDAVLLYGVCIGSQEDWNGEGSHPLESAARVLAAELGAELPPDWEDDWDYAISAILPKSLSLMITGHITGCPKWFLTAYYQKANRGYEHEFKKGLPEVSDRAEAALNNLAKNLDCGTPKWWLASYTDF